MSVRVESYIRYSHQSSNQGDKQRVAVAFDIQVQEGFRDQKVRGTYVEVSLQITNAISAQVPIPLYPDGYGVGGPADAHVVIEMFLDPLCPGCKASWPTVLEVFQAYGNQIHFRIHTFPLPYHTYSFLVSQGLHVVANVTNRNLDSIYRYTTKVFESQDKWSNNATASMTMPAVIDSLASFVDQTGLVPKAKFLAGIESVDTNFETRVSWKYACTRNVAGTPTFFINGVLINASSSWTLKDWKAVIDPILARNDVCPLGEQPCTYAPKKTECCFGGERCIPNVGCRCFNLRNADRCF